jgi:PAS domain S-box-containing protein
MNPGGRAEQPWRILLLEDVSDDAALVIAHLRQEGMVNTRCAGTRAEFLAALSDFRPEVVVADYKLPDITGREALGLLQERNADIPFIVLTGALGDELAVDIIKAGATDYLLKDGLFRLGTAIRRAMREAELRIYRKQAERALQESEERFRQMAENIREVLWMTDPEKNQVIYVSPGYEAIWGRTRQSLYDSSWTWLEAIHSEDRARVKEAALTKQISGEYDETYRIIRSDSSVRWIQDRAFPIRDEGGNVYRVVGIAEDITRRKQTEEALRQGEARKTAIMQASPDAIVTLDGQGEMVEFNSAAEKIFGWSRSQAAGRRITDTLIAPALREWFERGLRASFVGEDGPMLDGRVEMRCLRADGSEFPVEMTMTRIMLDGPAAFTAFIRDVTARKQAEAQLTTLAHAVESTTEPICITDLADRFVFVNRAFEETYGYVQADILGKTPEILFSERNAPRLLHQILSQTRLGGWRGELLDRKKDGTEFPIFLSTSQIKDPAGRVIGLIGVAQDITERKRSEQQIRLLADAMESTQEFISLTDEQNRFTFVNRALIEAYGYTKEEILGRTPDFLYSRKNASGLCEEVFQGTLRGGWRGEVLNVTKAGKEFPVALSTSLIRSADGAILGLIGVAKDVSDEKLREKRNMALSRLGHRLSAATLPEQAATIIVEIAWELFQWDAAYVHLYSPGNDSLIPVLTVDTINGVRTPVSARTFTTEPSPLMRLVLKEGARLINRPNGAAVSVPLVPFGQTNRPSASMMYVPIRSGSGPLGILSVQSYSPEAYRDSDLMLLQELADHCGAAIERIEVAAALARAESKYRSIFEHATEGIFQTTYDGRYLSANPALARMFGYETPEDLISSVAHIETQTFVSPAAASELKRLLAANDVVSGFEAERYRKDRSRFWTSINVRVIRGPDGSVRYYEGTVQDITKRKQTESVLRESERKLRLIAENTQDVIFGFNMQREPIYVNAALEAMTGYTLEEIQRQKFINWIHPHDQERMLRLWEDLYAGIGYFGVEFRLITKQGETKWCSSTWGPLYDESGQQIGVQGRETDITERKHLERELVESSNNERRRVGHELHDGLGQYLAGIAFRAKALEQALATDGVQHAATARELAGLVSNAINQTRSIARGLDPVDVETIGLPAALQNLAVETQKFFNLNCIFACPDDIPHLKPDAGLVLYRIAQESIHNAITHGNAKTVQIELAVEGNDVVIRIRDDGMGFDPETGNESGMGLRVMQYRARSVGGRVIIHSKKAAGTEVACLIPSLVCLVDAGSIETYLQREQA